eukprot:g41585.t1
MLSSLERVLKMKAMERVEKLFLLFSILYFLRKLYRYICKKDLTQAISLIPGASTALAATLDKEVAKAAATMFCRDMQANRCVFPKQGRKYDQIMADLKTAKSFDPEEGKTFAYMYAHQESLLRQLLEEAYRIFMWENALNAPVFPALRKFEVEVCTMTQHMLHAPETAVGTMTSCGTESVMSAVNAYRQRYECR